MLNDIVSAVRRLLLRGESWTIPLHDVMLRSQIELAVNQLKQEEAHAHHVSQLRLQELSLPTSFADVHKTFRLIFEAYHGQIPQILIMPVDVSEYIKLCRSFPDPKPLQSPITAEYLEWHLHLIRPIGHAADLSVMGLPLTPIEIRLREAMEHLGLTVTPYVNAASRYTLDFLVASGSSRLGVECDGRAYHLDPKRDQIRDERIQAHHNLEVLRFSGSAIFRDADQCALVVKKALNEHDRKSANLPFTMSDLDQDQQKAASHLRGPCLVVAPAGSGKTRVIMERCRHLIENEGV